MYQTEPQAERLAARGLTRAGYQGYMPLIVTRRQDAVFRLLFHKVVLPRFPGYGFVKLAPADLWLPIRQIAGVTKMLLGCDGRPAPIGVGELEAHMADDERLCDLTREVVLPPIPRGERVIIVAGALASFGGPVLACDGLVTLVAVAMFGRVMPVRLDRAIVEAA